MSRPLGQLARKNGIARDDQTGNRLPVKPLRP
jgi:hypothetical protein